MLQVSTSEREIGVVSVEVLCDEGPTTASPEDEEKTSREENETEDNEGRSDVVEGC